MSVDYESVIINTKVLFPCNLNLDLAHLVPYCSSAFVEVVLDVLYVHNDELREPITT